MGDGGDDGDGGFPFRFECKRSGNCCSIPGGVVRLEAADIQAIAAHMEMGDAAFRARYVAPGCDRLVDGPGPACVFLREGATTSCSIYPVRPEKCRTWPFWAELRDDPEAVRRAMSRCPGIESPDEDCAT
jgi:uncharacterized protein